MRQECLGASEARVCRQLVVPSAVTGSQVPTEEKGGVTPYATVSRGLPVSMQRGFATVNKDRVRLIP